jgi:hypothetical protein
MSSFGGKDRNNSFFSDASSHPGKRVEEPILMYHESARSIVFRDHLRRAVRHGSSSSSMTEAKPDVNISPQQTREGAGGKKGDDGDVTNVATEMLGPNLHALQGGAAPTEVAGFQPKIVPLPALELGPADEYEDLLGSKCDENSDEFTEAEKDVCQMLREQRCTVKTIKNVDWTDFLRCCLQPRPNRGGTPHEHGDIAPDNEEFPFNSFVTSTSLLPPDGKRMRCFGSSGQYTIGVMFALPSEFTDDTAEDEAAACTQTWSWPSGYSVRTCNLSSSAAFVDLPRGQS